MTNQTTCTLDGYTFPFNAPKQVPYQPVSATYEPTLQGGVITTYGVIVSDQTIELMWPTIPTAIYNVLVGKVALVKNLVFTDWNDPPTSYTVFCMDLKPADGQLKGSLDALMNVTLKMQVVSMP